MRSNRYLLLLASLVGFSGLIYGGYKLLQTTQTDPELSDKMAAIGLREAQEMLGIKTAPTEQQKQAEKRLKSALNSTSQSVREEAAVALLDLYLVTGRIEQAKELAKINELQGGNVTKAATVDALLEIYRNYGEEKTGDRLIAEAAQNPVLEKSYPRASAELKVTNGMRIARIKYDAKNYKGAKEILEKLLDLASKYELNPFVEMVKEFLADVTAWQAVEFFEQRQLRLKRLTRDSPIYALAIS